MFKDDKDLKKYIEVNYPEVTDNRIESEHWDLQCTSCKITRGFQVVKREVGTYRSEYNDNMLQDSSSPNTYYFRCPVCKSFKMWIVFQITYMDKTHNNRRYSRYFRVTSIPGEGLEEIEELPENPPSLREAYRQAIRAMDANANLAAAAMFRRALQVITRDLLGVKPGNLAFELKAAVGKPYNGGIITKDFADVGYIVKEAGNQAAHPDKDPNLLDFTAQDGEDLQNIFMEIVGDLFIVPAAKQKAKAEFLARRKITV